MEARTSSTIRIHARAFASSDAHVSVLHCRMRTEEADTPEIRLLRWGSRTLWRWYAQQTPHPEIGLDGTDASVTDDRIYITQDLGTTRFCLGLLGSPALMLREDGYYSEE